MTLAVKSREKLLLTPLKQKLGERLLLIREQSFWKRLPKTEVGFLVTSNHQRTRSVLKRVQFQRPTSLKQAVKLFFLSNMIPLKSQKIGLKGALGCLLVHSSIQHHGYLCLPFLTTICPFIKDVQWWSLLRLVGVLGSFWACFPCEFKSCLPMLTLTPR